MRVDKVIAAAMLIALAGCSGSGGNETQNEANVAAEEGMTDLNAAVSGDELAPVPEAADDLAANGANAAAPPAD